MRRAPILKPHRYRNLSANADQFIFIQQGTCVGPRIGRFIYQYRWLVLLVWLGAAGLLALIVPPPDSTVGETTDLLPSDTPIHQTWQELAEHFGDKSMLSDVAIVFERSDAPLSSQDLADVETIGSRLPQAIPDDPAIKELGAITVRTPSFFAMTGDSNPLISEDHHAALILVGLPFNFISKEAARVVKHTQDLVISYPMHSGISAAVTGSAGYGYDYAVATRRSHEKTILVTLIAVIAILLAIYRAPLAAMIPLAGVSVAALIVMMLVTAGEKIGLHSGTAERIFTFVLLYGAGIDYSLLLISRYREFLDNGYSLAESLIRGLNASFAAIASSTAMTVSGLVMLCLARFSVFRDAGPGVVLAVIVAAAAAVTLVPAILAIVGTKVFWPNRIKVGEIGQIKRSRLWPTIAGFVIRRPALISALVLIAMVLPGWRGAQISWNYDALFSLKPTYQARRGSEIVQRHWPIGETAPVTVLAVAPKPQSVDAWKSACTAIVQNVRQIPDIGNVRAATSPLGLHVDAAKNLALQLLAGDRINAEFISPDGRAMRLMVVLSEPALTRRAMDDVSNISSGANRALTAAGLDAQVHLAGETAEMIDIRTVTQRDFHRIAVLSLTAITIMLIVVLRDVPLAFFIVIATLLSYFTTLGLSCWTFAAFGGSGLEWKVQMLLFVVLVAVGQDYSVFFAVRFAQEARQLPCRPATERAIIFTGPVISSCGLIMAATLGSVMVGDVTLLVQLGFAFSLGMLIDTFIVRPLLLPAFIVLTNRNLKHAMAFI